MATTGGRSAPSALSRFHGLTGRSGIASDRRQRRVGPGWAECRGGDRDRNSLPDGGASHVDLTLALDDPWLVFGGFLQVADAAVGDWPRIDLTLVDQAVVTPLAAPWHGVEIALVVLRHGSLVWFALLNPSCEVIARESMRGVAVIPAADRDHVIVRVPKGERVIVTDFMSWEPPWDVSREASAAVDSWQQHLLQSGFDRCGTDAPRGFEDGERPRDQRPQVLGSLAGAGRPK